MTDTLYLIRALKIDEVAKRLADTISDVAGCKVVFVCDESKGTTDTTPYEKISLTEARLKTLGITDQPADWGWFWGDVCYYAALARFPEYDHFCLIESDVFLSPKAAKVFVEKLQARPEEAIALRLGQHKEPPRYSKPLKRLGLDARWGCIFPVSRVHRRVIRAMLALRKRAISEIPDLRLNDESMLAGAVQEGGFSFARLEEVAPDQFRPESFDTNPPHLFEPLVAREGEMRAFHPVVTQAKVLERIANREKNYNKHRLRKVLKTASPEARSEIMAALNA